MRNGQIIFCMHKVAFNTFAKATRHAMHFKHKTKQDETRPDIYKCKFCGMYHASFHSERNETEHAQGTRYKRKKNLKYDQEKT